jgi:hypothetical protein
VQGRIEQRDGALEAAHLQGAARIGRIFVFLVARVETDIELCRTIATTGG